MNESKRALPLSSRLKALRAYRGVTQEQLAGEHLTRNMLSQIERGAALPSYATLLHLSKALNVEPSYFFENGPSLSEVIERETLTHVRAHFAKKQYNRCLSEAENVDIHSPELLDILSASAYFLGYDSFECGDFSACERYFAISLTYGARSPLGCRYSAQIRFYKLIIDRSCRGIPFHIPSLLSLMSDDPSLSDAVEYIYLRALIDNGQFEDAERIYDTLNIREPMYRIHINARMSAARKNYDRAKELLLSIVNDESRKPLHPFLYSVYSDLERYFKATDDFEGAYRCAVDKQKYQYHL